MVTREYAVHLGLLVGSNLLAALLMHVLEWLSGVSEFPTWLRITRAVVVVALGSSLVLIVRNVKPLLRKWVEFAGALIVGLFLLFCLTLTPNLLALNATDALRKAQQRGLIIEFLGDGAGLVAEQSPPPGTWVLNVSPFDQIILDTEAEEAWNVTITSPTHEGLVDSDCEVKGVGDIIEHEQLFLYLLVRRENELRADVFGPVLDLAGSTWMQPVDFDDDGQPGDRFQLEAWIVGDRQLPSEIAMKDLIPARQPNTKRLDGISVILR